MNLEDERGSRVEAAQAERRLHPRYHIKIQIELFAEGNGQPLQLDTVDLSRNGCCVWIQNPLPVGTRLRAVLHLATKPVVVRGCVVTRHPRFGNGIMFLVFEGDGDERLRKYLESLRGETID